MVDNIAVRIALEGAADVQNKLKQLGLEGEAAFAKLKQATGGLAPALDGAGQGVDRLGAQATRGSVLLNGFQAAMAGIRPAAAAAGAQLGAFGALAGASRAGIVGLAAAVTGALLVSLAKVADQSTIAKERLSELLNSKAAGNNAFKQLDQDAKKLGTDAANFLPALEEILKAGQKLRPLEITPSKTLVPDELGVPQLKDLERLPRVVEEGRRALAGLGAALKQSGASGEEAGAALQSFFKSIIDQGKLTEDALKSLQSASPRAANAVAQGLGRSNAGELLNDIARGATIAADSVLSSGSRISDKLFSDFEKAKDSSRTFGAALEELGASIKRIGNDAGVGSAATTVVDTYRQGLETLAEATKIAISAIRSGFATLWPEIQAGGSAFIDHLKLVFNSLVSDLQSIGDSIASALTSGFETARDAILSIINSIKAAWKSVTDAAGGSGLDGSEPSLSDSGGFAQGGLIRGPGTGTSDSILASAGRRLIRVSNGEFIIRDAARRYYGADMLQAINQMKLPRNLLRGFNMGGLVTGMEHALASLPGFAAGGEVQLAGGGMHPVILQLPGGEQVGGLSVKHSVLDQLIRELRLKALTQSGGEPWRGR